MPREREGSHRRLLLSTEEKPLFTRRQVEVLQYLVDGMSSDLKIAQRYGISHETVASCKRDLLDKVEHSTGKRTLTLAIVLGVTSGFLDVSRLPDGPKEKLTAREQRIVVMMLEGFNPAETCEQLRIEPNVYDESLVKIVSKFDVAHRYQVAAIAAKMAKAKL